MRSWCWQYRSGDDQPAALCVGHHPASAGRAAPSVGTVAVPFGREGNEAAAGLGVGAILAPLRGGHVLDQGKETFVTADEFGQDLEHVEVLQRKFDEFQKDMASQEYRVTEVNELADKLLSNGHPARETITRSKEELNEAWQRLKQLAILRQEKLFGAHDIQRFNRDADETVAWIAEKDVVLSSDDYGRDLASVQALQRKHEGVKHDLAALEDKLPTGSR